MPANIRTHPSFLVEEGLPAEDGAEGALAQLPVDDDAVARDLPLVERQEGGGRHQAQRAHPVLRLTHLHLVPACATAKRNSLRVLVFLTP